jgi:hypothetical protein
MTMSRRQSLQRSTSESPLRYAHHFPHRHRAFSVSASFPTRRAAPLGDSFEVTTDILKPSLEVSSDMIVPHSPEDPTVRFYTQAKRLLAMALFPPPRILPRPNRAYIGMLPNQVRTASSPSAYTPIARPGPT